MRIHQSTTDKLIISVIEAIKDVDEVKHKTKKYGLPPNKLLASLSFTHLVELIKIENNLKRAFYELECAKGVWSVSELLSDSFKHEIGG